MGWYQRRVHGELHSNSSSSSKLTMRSFVAVLAFVASVSAKAAYIGHPLAAGYGYPYAYGYTAAAPVAYAHQPVAYAAAPFAGVYAHAYDPSVAYANLYPLAEPYVHEEIAAEPYVDAQIE